MITISKRQWNAIQENLQNAYLRKLVKDFRKSWADNEELSQKWIQEKAKDAEVFGIEGRFALKRFFELCLSEGSDFPHGGKYTWAKLILLDKQRTEGEKLNHIEWTLTMGEGEK